MSAEVRSCRKGHRDRFPSGECRVCYSERARNRAITSVDLSSVRSRLDPVVRRMGTSRAAFARLAVEEKLARMGELKEAM